MQIDLDEKITKLYKSGLSTKQLANKLSISYSKVRYSLEKQSIKCRNRSDAIRSLNITKFGKKEFVLKNNLNFEEIQLKIAGVMLYWGEGTKSGNSVVFSNSDPDMVRHFLKFLREICGIDNSRLRLLLHFYQNQDEKDLKLFWSRTTQIPLSQFSKSYMHKSREGSYKKISDKGTISMRYSDKFLLDRINKWINTYRMPM